LSARSTTSLIAHGYKVLYSFKGGKDGQTPASSLLNVNGKLYGTTLSGGGCTGSSLGCGTVFELSVSGAEHVLHRFAGYPKDGAFPYAGLVDFKNLLYGTTSEDGSSFDGTVYTITTSGSEHILYSFTGDDGKFPAADLLQVNGALFGTTRYGGPPQNCYSETCGTVFALTTSGKEHVVHSFKASQPPKDGVWPYSGLTFVHGAFYGTTTLGGAYGLGTVFRVTASGKEQVVYSFQGHHDGARPQSPVLSLNGELYGITTGGGAYGFGTVFALTTSGKEKLVYVFKGGPTDGNGPNGRLAVINGVLYGTTYTGGTRVCFSNGSHCGTIFKLTTSGQETVLYNFKGGKDGGGPGKGLTALNGVLYGTTSFGGTGACTSVSQGTKGCGTVFQILP
jgi:uncharacterized repeat protein (TIGR03803 family)